MKLGLLGYPIDHSLSPMLYNKFLGTELISYEKFSYKNSIDVPTIDYFQQRLSGLNITSPYKSIFIDKVIIESDVVKELGGINTIAFRDHGIFGTNTDYIAVKEILKNLSFTYQKINLILIGDGVMARVTKLAARELGITLEQYSRKLTPEFSSLEFRSHKSNCQTVIINSASRDFIFKFPVAGNEIFWDFNYSFEPHERLLPSVFKTYINGQELLELQAKEAIKFWKEL